MYVKYSGIVHVSCMTTITMLSALPRKQKKYDLVVIVATFSEKMEKSFKRHYKTFQDSASLFAPKILNLRCPAEKEAADYSIARMVRNRNTV